MRRFLEVIRILIALGALILLMNFALQGMALQEVANPNQNVSNQKNIANSQTQYAGLIVSSIQLLTVSGLKEKAAYCTSHPKTTQEEWLQRYACNISIGEAYLGIFSFLLVLVTGGLVAATVRQEARANKRAIMELRAYIATNSLPNFTFQLRQPQPNPNHLPDRRFQTVIQVINSGRTPAYEVFILGGLCIADYPPNEQTVFPIVTAPRDHSRGTIVAGQIRNVPLGADQIYSDADVAEARQNREVGKRFYLYGTVTYRDAFGIERHTHFRHSSMWLNQNFPSWVNTNKGNEIT